MVGSCEGDAEEESKSSSSSSLALQQGGKKWTGEYWDMRDEVEHLQELVIVGRQALLDPCLEVAHNVWVVEARECADFTQNLDALVFVRCKSQLLDCVRVAVKAMLDLEHLRQW